MNHQSSPPLHEKKDPPSLFFVFVGYHRPWTTLAGVTPPSGSIWEARAYPSLEYAIGESWEEAKENLRKLLDHEIRATQNEAAWYAQQVAKLGERDRASLHAAAFKWITGATSGGEINVGSGGRLVAQLQPGLMIHTRAADWLGDLEACVAWAWIDR